MMLILVSYPETFSKVDTSAVPGSGLTQVAFILGRLSFLTMKP